MAEALAVAERGRLNTDDRTLVEFGFARMAADNGALSGKEIRKLSRARLEHRPANFEGGDRLEPSRRRLGKLSGCRGRSRRSARLPGPEARVAATPRPNLSRETRTRQSRSGYRSTASQTPTELASLAMAMANAGDDRA